MKIVSEKRPDLACCAITFSILTEVENALDTQAKELEEVCRELYKDGANELNIFATSMGAYSTCLLLSNEQLSEIIKTVILFDPADYYFHQKVENLTSDITWAGYRDYDPKQSVVSDLLKNLSRNVTVHIIHLTMRTYTSSGYVEAKYSKRTVDHPEAYPRLSTRMIKSMYAKLPDKNKGVYQEINNVPHGFFRDGDVAQNQVIITSTVCKLLPE